MEGSDGIVMDDEAKSSGSRPYFESSSILDPHGMKVLRRPSSNCTAMRQRSYTDPTDLLAVFRRRINSLDENHNIPCCRDRAETMDKELSTKLKNSADLDCVPPGKFLQMKKSSNESLSSRVVMKNCSRNSKINSDDSSLKDENDSLPEERPTFRERKISAPAYRSGRRNSQVFMQLNAHRRCSIAGPPRRMGRRGSEVPALSSLARKRSTFSPAYPVGLKGRGSRGLSNAEFHLSNIQVKAKHEMLANLVLPAFNEHTFRTRERRTTCSCHPASALTKKDEKRLHVTNEILHTEKKYLTCLNTLKTVFEDPLRDENLISVKEIDIIFPSELDLIRDSHTLFMKELEDRVQNWKQYGIVGDIFTKLSSSYHIDVLKIYSDYVNNFPKAMAVINKYSRGSQKFRRFLQNCSAEPECEGLDLAAYLLTPIQRLPRYVLLLRQLSKCTDSSHPDSFHLENALETMKNMINILNDSIHNSCKIVSTSISRRSSKRRSLGKRKNLKDLKITKDDNDNRIIHTKGTSDSGKSPKSPPKSPPIVVSTCGVDSPSSSPSTPQDSYTEGDRQSTSSADHSILTRLKSGENKSRPVSTGDLDQFYNVDNAKEFNAIVEEAEGKDDKTYGQSKIKSAAESVKRSWQRRSKKWRRSFEGKAISTNALPELGKEERSSSLTFSRSAEKFRFDSATSSKSPTISPAPSIESAPLSSTVMDDSKFVACNPLILDESDGNPSSACTSPAISANDSLESGLERTEELRHIPNVGTISEQEELVLRTFPKEGSPYSRHKNTSRKKGVQERPLSVALPMQTDAGTNKHLLEDKSKSDNDILNSENVPIWIHQQQRPRLQKRHSESVLRQHLIRRKSSTQSCDRTSETTGTSVGSLDTSKDSMLDSGVSADTQDDSPINTLTRPENSSRNTDNFTQLSEKERLVFDEVIASGFKDNQRTTSQIEHDDKVKNKRKFKDVVKHMFSKTKKRSGRTEDDSVQQRPKAKILTRSKSLNVRASKDPISSLI